MIKQAYINGFMRKCAERGIDGRRLLQKQARSFEWASDLLSSAGRAISRGAKSSWDAVKRLIAGNTDGDLGSIRKKVVGEPGVRVPAEAVAEAQLKSTLRRGSQQWDTRPILSSSVSGHDARVLAARAKLKARPEIGEHKLIGPRIRALAAQSVSSDKPGIRSVTDADEGIYWFDPLSVYSENAKNAIRHLAEGSVIPPGHKLPDGKEVVDYFLNPSVGRKVQEALKHWDPETGLRLP